MRVFFLIKDGYTVLILYSMHRVVLKAFGQGTTHGTLCSQVNQFRSNSLPDPLILKLCQSNKFISVEDRILLKALKESELKLQKSLTI